MSPPDIPCATLANLISDDEIASDSNPRTISVYAEFSDVFAQLPSELPPERVITHHIDLIPGSKPLSRSPYRMCHWETQHLRERIEQLEALGFIRPSVSPWASPVLFIAKKNGKLRFCVDYRALNKLTVKNRFPLPTMDVLMDKLHGSRIFSKIDLQSAYHQIRIHPNDIEKSAFVTPFGLFEYTVLPFSMCNASATFQSLM